MRFEYGRALWLLLALVPLAGGAYLLYRRSLSNLTYLVGQHQRVAFMEALTFKRFVTGFLFHVALALGVVAIADPHWGEQSIEDERRGLEVVFLMDVSNSMLAEDVAPNRLARSREVARAVYARLSDMAAGVIAFKGDETVISPMTEDSVAFERAMDILSGALVSTAGTDIEAALRVAADSFPGRTERRKVVLLFTDGQEISGNYRGLFRNLRGLDVTVVTVATGTAAGSMIPLPTGGVLRDLDGNPVVAGVDLDGLETLAAETGGKHFSINDAAVVNQLTDYLEEVSAKGRSVVFRVRETPRYRLFVVLSVSMLVLSVLFEIRRWGRVV